MRRVIPIGFSVVVVLGFVAIVYGFVMRGERVVQPIVFNHMLHVQDVGLECIECHTGAQTRVYAGIPGKDICLDCHDVDEERGDHPEKDKLFAFGEHQRDIPWIRIALTAPDVYYSHRRHVTSAGLDCTDCHADQRQLVSPPHRARVVMSMEACIDCHDASRASIDCLVCHR